MAIVTLAIMLILIFIGFDIALAMVAAAFIYFLVGGVTGDATQPLSIIPQVMGDALRHELLIAVPLFILTGMVMSKSGITERLMKVLYIPLGRFRGPLGYVNVGASLVMSGMSGSSVADAAATSTVMIDPMVRSGYTRVEAGALTAASATIGPIVPPSIPFVLIGGLTTVSVGQLFVAGVVPGFFMGVALLALVAFMSRRKDRVPITDVFGEGLEISTWRLVAQIAVAVLVPVVIMGGIVFGATTATEAGALGAAVALVGALAVFRLRDLRILYGIMRETFVVSGAILITLATSAIIGWILAIEQVGRTLGGLLGGLADQPTLLWLVLIVAFLILGLVVEPIAVILIVSPIIYPQLPFLDIDPLHFSVVMTVTLMIGLITPPVGLNLFTVAKAGRVDLRALTRKSAPYVAALVVASVVLALVPGLTLWLPDLIYR